ncbi:MAG: hypothetical protein ACI4MN_01565 [Candidatus Coproplasma sp.]
MKWSKRLKWIKVSKIVIPIALAISIIFAGFSVFANEAKNFVVDVSYNENIKLSLTYYEEDAKNLTNLTDHLDVPVLGKYRDVSWVPDSNPDSYYENISYSENLPDDIAMHDGIHTVFSRDEIVSFFSFSFYLVNSSKNKVNVEVSINIDEIVTNNNATNKHVDDALRVMVIEGKHLLSENANTTIYKKDESNEANQQWLDEHIAYNAYPIISFKSNTCVMQNDKSMCELAAVGDPDGNNIKRYTIVLWLEGWDYECTDEILPEAMKMSMSFKGYV